VIDYTYAVGWKIGCSLRLNFPLHGNLISMNPRLEARLYATRRIAQEVIQRGRPGLVVTMHGSLGDHLLCTAVFRELRLRGFKRLWMASRFNFLFEDNDDVDAVIPENLAWSHLVRWLGGRVICLDYSRYVPEKDMDTTPEQHVLTVMNRVAGVKGEVTLRPYYTPSPNNSAALHSETWQVCVQTSGIGAQSYMRNKDWFPERMQQVVSLLESEFDFVQIGSLQDPPLAGAKDLRGRTSIPETAQLLSQSRLFVGQVGFLMHLARAVNCRSVIIYGGRELPGLTGYGANLNLSTPMPCSPCWLRNRCEYDRECMKRITAEDVAAAIHRASDSYGQPLMEDIATLF
jgi:ADP-heptose:LPS heptosyltransferase